MYLLCRATHRSITYRVCVSGALREPLARDLAKKRARVSRMVFAGYHERRRLLINSRMWWTATRAGNINGPTELLQMGLLTQKKRCCPEVAGACVRKPARDRGLQLFCQRRLHGVRHQPDGPTVEQQVVAVLDGRRDSRPSPECPPFGRIRIANCRRTESRLSPGALTADSWARSNLRTVVSKSMVVRLLLMCALSRIAFAVLIAAPPWGPYLPLDLELAGVSHQLRYVAVLARGVRPHRGCGDLGGRSARARCCTASFRHRRP